MVSSYRCCIVTRRDNFYYVEEVVLVKVDVGDKDAFDTPLVAIRDAIWA
jgi:hypothetical protein